MASVAITRNKTAQHFGGDPATLSWPARRRFDQLSGFFGFQVDLFPFVEFLPKGDGVPILVPIDQQKWTLVPRSARVRSMLITGVIPTPPATKTQPAALCRSTLKAPVRPVEIGPFARPDVSDGRGEIAERLDGECRLSAVRHSEADESEKRMFLESERSTCSWSATRTGQEQTRNHGALAAAAPGCEHDRALGIALSPDRVGAASAKALPDARKPAIQSRKAPMRSQSAHFHGSSR